LIKKKKKNLEKSSMKERGFMTSDVIGGLKIRTKRLGVRKTSAGITCGTKDLMLFIPLEEVSKDGQW
jgi:hypothetical protein